jgi:cobalt-zinc-cadmium efflux system outer membrane protein
MGHKTQMPFCVRKIAILSLLCGLCSCATYRPAPLKPDVAASEFTARTLANPKLCEYLRENSAGGRTACPPARWNLANLTLASFFYSPDLAVAEAQFNVARAAIVTAGQRPNPSVGLGTAYAATAAPNFAPWALGAAEINFPIETAGKRGYRIAQAQRLADASAIGVGEAAWRVRSAVRRSLLNYMVARRSCDLARAYEAESERIARILQERVAAGALSAPELSLALANLSSARLKTTLAQSRVQETLNGLASAIGVPVGALQNAAFAWPDFEYPPDAASLTAASVRKLALLDRLDLRRMLAQYAAADEALKFEIARQYPDINLAGGYSWEVNENIFELFPVVMLPLMNQNQGPIAEARARRAQTAEQFIALQDSIIGQTNGALTNYRGALAALRQASRVVDFSKERLARIRQAADLGDVDSLTLATAHLETVVAEQSKLTALLRAQSALGALEDAVERPFEDGGLKSFTLPRALQSAASEQTS